MWIPNLPVTILTTTAAAGGILCLYKDYRSGARFDKAIRADGMTVIVTGASSGIGLETAYEFATRGAKVFMACRSMEKCEEARRRIVLETENKFVYCRLCDLASTESIREFVKRFKQEEPYLDVLVNNAGVMDFKVSRTKDGFESQLGVNHFGHFLLTNLLLDRLKATAPSRIVIVSSQAHFKGKINTEDINSNSHYDSKDAYNQSKLANVLFGKELARRLIDSEIAVSIVDPGLSDTYLTRNLPMAKSVSRYFIYPLFWPTLKLPRMAAQSVLHAALDKSTENSCGDYFVDMKPVPASPEAEDFEMAQWLWKVSEKWTKLNEHQAILNKELNEMKSNRNTATA